MNRETLIKTADSLEDLMCETGKGTTEIDRKVWWLCKPLWLLLQDILKHKRYVNDKE